MGFQFMLKGTLSSHWLCHLDIPCGSKPNNLPFQSKVCDFLSLRFRKVKQENDGMRNLLSKNKNVDPS